VQDGSCSPIGVLLVLRRIAAGPMAPWD